MAFYAGIAFFFSTAFAQTAPPAPYATPLGFSDDVTAYLSPSNSTSGIGYAKKYMLANINYPGSANGTVIAAISFQNPDYAYNWVRDASLTMAVVQTLYSASSSADTPYAKFLTQYAEARRTEQLATNTQTGLGEPKWNLNNTVFTGPWGRPQNDGPATSAIAIMEFIQAYLESGGSAATAHDLWQVPKTDLDFVAANWSSPSFDIWEEVESQHYYNRLVSYRALTLGASIAASVNETASSTWAPAAEGILASLGGFWDSQLGYLQYDVVGSPVQRNKNSGLDVAVILGVLRSGGVASYADDKVLATAHALAMSFLEEYPITAQKIDWTGGQLGIPIGRYPEDVYTGTGTAPNGGNPWFLATNAFAELFYQASYSIATAQSLTISNTSLPFWTYFAPSAGLGESTYDSSTSQFQTALNALQGWGDSFIRLDKYHGGKEGHLSEEFDRKSGYEVGAGDLTWSYASLLTAGLARALAMGDTGFANTLATLE